MHDGGSSGAIVVVVVATSLVMEGVATLIMGVADTGSDDGIAGRSLRGMDGRDILIIRCWGAIIPEC